MKTKGQVTVYVIIALAIMVIGVLIYFFSPGARSLFGGDITPSSFLKECISDEVHNGIELLSEQGGYANPEGFILYNGKKVKYLCYTAQYANSEDPYCR